MGGGRVVAGTADDLWSGAGGVGGAGDGGDGEAVGGVVGGLVDGGDAVRADDSKVGGEEAEAVSAGGGDDDAVGWVAEDGEKATRVARYFRGDG